MSDAQYPIAIIEDRYRGTYSGGAWLAIAAADVRLPSTASQTRIEFCLHGGPHGDDIEAMEFWRHAPDWIAAAATPDAALALLKQGQPR